MADEKLQPSAQPRHQHRAQDPEGRRKLREASDSLKRKTRDAAIAREDTLRSKISQKLGLDLDAVYDETRAEQAEVEREIHREKELFRQQAQALAANERQLFNEHLGWALKKGNLRKHLRKIYHNPSIVMKLTSDCAGDCSTPAGISGGSGQIEPPQSEAEYHCQLYQEPILGVNYVDTIHPYCRADAGSNRTGYAHAWAEQQLTYVQQPPASFQLCDEVELWYSAFGYGEAHHAEVIYLSVSLAMQFGGSAKLLLSISVEQDYDRGENHYTQTIEVARDIILAQFSSPGATWLFGGVTSPIVWGPVSLQERLTFRGRVFGIYGADDPRVIGGPVRVVVTFRCEAEGDHRQADGEIGFRLSDGHGIKVHQVTLRQPR